MIRRRPGRFATKWTQKDPAWVSRAAARPSKISNGPREFAYLISLRDGGNPVTGSGRQQVEDLLLLAMSRPQEAITRAGAAFLGGPPESAAGNDRASGGRDCAARHPADVQAGVRELRAALGLARRLGSTRPARLTCSRPHGHRAGPVRPDGRRPGGLRECHRPVWRRAARTRVASARRYDVNLLLGSYPARAGGLAPGRVPLLKRAGDVLWAARALNSRGLVYLSLGSPRRADADFAAAERLFGQTSQELEPVHTVLNRGLSAFPPGDFPRRWPSSMRLRDATGRWAFHPPAQSPPVRGIAGCRTRWGRALEADAGFADQGDHGRRLPRRWNCC